MAVAYASPPPPAGAATAGCTQEQATEANPRPLHSNDHLPLAIPARNVTGQTGRGRQQYAEAADHPNTEHAYGHEPRYLGCYPKLGVVNQIRDTAAQHVPLMRAKQAPR